ncbi:MAG TPA: AMP-binding protein, partial [Verrucomicrobiae bacterium]|nr:AMP-binding protein [Verrucomicrobiae bacterium]
MLPASYNAAVANLAVHFAGGTALNLDPTAGGREAAERLVACGSRLVLASRNITVVKNPGEAETVFVEETLAKISRAERWLTAIYLLILPAALLGRLYGNRNGGADAPAHIVYSAGTGGRPRPVVLSHHKMVSNSRALAQVFWVTREDRFATILPLHHAFGLTATLWFPLLSGCAVAWHRDPSDPSSASRLARSFEASIFVANTAWLKKHADRLPGHDFVALKYVFTGGDTVSQEFREAWEAKFSVPLMEGYGCSEMAPVIAVSVPDFVEGHRRQAGSVAGSVGHPIPGVSVKIVDAATAAVVPTGEPGLLLAKGPNRMLGYYNDPEGTAAALRN